MQRSQQTGPDEGTQTSKNTPATGNVWLDTFAHEAKDFMRWGERIAGSIPGLRSLPFAQNPPKLKRVQVDALKKAGYTKGKQHGDWISPTGKKIHGKAAAQQIARKLLKQSRNAPATTPPIIPSIPDITVPPSVAPIIGAIIRQVPPLLITAGLFWPTAAGKGSDLRDYWAHNRPKTATPGGRTRGRRGTRAKPRRGRRPRAVTPPKVPVTWPGRGGPVTISRPRARTVPPPAVATVKLPKTTGVLGPGWARDTAGEPYTTPGSYGVPVSAPTRAPSTSRTSSASRSTSTPWPSSTVRTPPIMGPTTAAPAIGLPTMPGNWTDWLSLFQPGTAPKPKAKPQPVQALSPLTQPNTASVPFAAQAVQSKSCSCAKPRKRRQNECRNPVTQRKRETRGGHKFVTITKRLDCERGKQT